MAPVAQRMRPAPWAGLAQLAQLVQLVRLVPSAPCRTAWWRAALAWVLGLALGGPAHAAPLVAPVMQTDARIGRDGPLWLLAGQPMTGTLKRVSNDGVVTWVPLQHGQVHGLQTSRFANGQQRGEGRYVHGQAQGVHRAWWPSGQLQSEQNFSFDKPEGPMRTWYASGRPYQAHLFVQGQESGPQRVWFEDRRIRANYVVRDGRRYGSIGALNCDGGGQTKGLAWASAAPPRAPAVVEWNGVQAP
jgi:hypothetical protein